jgi:hypothetical protein
LAVVRQQFVETRHTSDGSLRPMSSGLQIDDCFIGRRLKVSVLRCGT